MLVSQYMNKSNDLYGVYDEIDPNWNSYQLIVCSFQQINPYCYFTLSGKGVSLIQNLNESFITPLDLWEDERAKFTKLRQIKFVKQFLNLKYFRMWHQIIRN